MYIERLQANHVTCWFGFGKWKGRSPFWAAETACFRVFSVSAIGFLENALAALPALATLVLTPPIKPGKAELCTALELATDEPGVVEMGVVTVVDDVGNTPDEGTLEGEAVLLDEIFITTGVLKAALLLGVAVAVQYSCGTTL